MAKIIMECIDCGDTISCDTGESIPVKKKEHMMECHPGFEEIHNEYKEEE